ncbi:MAG: NAD(+)/NADH kinase [Selenomonadaceae bacterium]|nr:NAD(+)/NADH kinase [Selenomonadaceae bacterium]
MQRIAVFPNMEKKDSGEMLKRLLKLSKKKNVEIALPMEAAKKFGVEALGHENVKALPIDLALSIGGDGTLLGVCRELGAKGIPVCGINIGTLGFLTEIEPDELNSKIEMILEKKYSIEEHLLLAGYVKNAKGDEKFLSYAVNDVVITKSGAARMIHLGLSINDTKLIDYKSDGIIIASPTGSTAYSLSAGGPIINPTVRALLVTPICAHTFLLRPIVVNENDSIYIKIMPAQKDVAVTFDGQESFNVSPSSEVIIKKSPTTAKIVKFKDKDYYKTLGEKFWGQGRKA